MFGELAAAAGWAGTHVSSRFTVALEFFVLLGLGVGLGRNKSGSGGGGSLAGTQIVPTWTAVLDCFASCRPMALQPCLQAASPRNHDYIRP